jgi:PRTRC genetic system protein B
METKQMKSSIDLHNTASVKLSDALLVYTGGRSGSSYVTRHRVNDGDLGPARPLSHDFLSSLADSLERTIPIEILPERVLMRTHGTIVWWTRPNPRQMFFDAREREGFESLNGSILPQPALLWTAHRRSLSVFALSGGERPTLDTRLLVAPYWNVSENGLVCLGTMRRPTTRSAAAIEQWEDSFFASAFTHPLNGKITSHPEGYAGLCAELEGSHRFPVQYLIDAKKTLGGFLRARKDK